MQNEREQTVQATECMGMVLSLQEDGTWRLDELRENAQLSGEAEGKPITHIAQYAFEYNSLLEDIALPEGIRSAQSNAFMSRWIRRVRIPASLTEVDGLAFSHCPRLMHIEVAPDNPQLSSENGVLFNKDKTRLLRFPTSLIGTSCQIPESVVELGPGSFADSETLSQVIIPGHVHTIDREAFRECGHVHTIMLEEGVRSIAPDAFDGCYMLDYFGFPESIESLGDESPFGNLAVVKHMRLPTWVTELPPWFDEMVDVGFLKILEAEGLTLDMVPRKYKGALTRGAAELYAKGIEPDEYAAMDFMVFAGDWRQYFMYDALYNENLRAYLLDHGILTSRDVTALAEEATRRGMIELAASLLEYAQTRMANSTFKTRGLEL